MLFKKARGDIMATFQMLLKHSACSSQLLLLKVLTGPQKSDTMSDKSISPNAFITSFS